MSQQVTRYVGNVCVNGVRLDNGATFVLSGPGEQYDVVSPTAAPGTLARTPDGAEPLGWLASVEGDGKCSVMRNPEYVVFKTTASIAPGIHKVVGDGTGGLKAAGAATAFAKINVYDSWLDGSQNYVLAAFVG